MKGDLEIKRDYFTDGQIRSEHSFLHGVPHGWHREWHPNGTLALEVYMKDGVPDGIGRQWDASGKLIVSYEIRNGTGIQKAWFEDQGIGGEISWIDGMMTGPQRAFLKDGDIVAYTYWIADRKVSRKKYVKECEQNPQLPRIDVVDEPISTGAAESHEPASADELASRILSKSDVHEALSWLKDPRAKERTLGEASTTGDSVALVESLYSAGAVRVWAFDVQDDSNGVQNAGRLLVELPDVPEARDRVLEKCSGIGGEQGFDPERDCGQRYVLLMLD
jgi:hypothetical protein